MKQEGYAAQARRRSSLPKNANAVIAAAVAVLIGCAAQRPGAPVGTTIAVQEFAIAPNAVTQRYGGDVGSVGRWYADLLAAHLQRLEYSAYVAPNGTPVEGDLRITGTICEVDGGNTAKRLLIGYGAGRSEFDVYGTVSKKDGTVVGHFTESRAGNGWTERKALEVAMRRTIQTIGNMVVTGVYRQNAPRGRPAAVGFERSMQAPVALASPDVSSASTADRRPIESRLLELDKLLRDGLIIQHEYKTRREAILDSL